MKNKILQNEIKRLKTTLKLATSTQAIHNILDTIYYKISNNNNDKIAKYFNTQEIFSGKQLKRIGRYITESKAVVFEFIDNKNAPGQFVVIYNEFENEQQKDIDIYITKGEQK